MTEEIDNPSYRGAVGAPGRPEAIDMTRDPDNLLWIRGQVRKAILSSMVFVILSFVGVILLTPPEKDWLYFAALVLGAVLTPVLRARRGSNPLVRNPNPLIYLFNSSDTIERKSPEVLEYLRPYRERFPQSWYWIACLCSILLLSINPFVKAQENPMFVLHFAVLALSMSLNLFMFDLVFFVYVAREWLKDELK